MAKLLLIALVLLAGCKLLTGRWPWQFLVSRSARDVAVSRARKLLAVRAGAGRGEILEAHKRLLAVVHPDRGGTNDQVHEANAARDLLLGQLPEQT